MIDPAVSQFVEDAIATDSAAWDGTTVQLLADSIPPWGRGGSSDWILRGDANMLWARWFLEGLADPQPFIAGEKEYPHLYKEVRDAVTFFGSHLPADERTATAKAMARLLWQEIERRSPGRRVSIDREQRLLLWDLYPRCWICGAGFTDWARDSFLGEESDAQPSTLRFVDFYKGRGKLERHLQIEVEHVVAHAAGGRNDESNLRLACGWCNMAKSKWSSLYDIEGTPIRRKHPRLGSVSAPRPFWIVRFLAIRGRCEDQSGCQARTDDVELTVAPRRLGGTPNPANLMVVCPEHDPLSNERLVAARFFD